MQLTASEKALLAEILDKQIWLAESDRKSLLHVTGGNKTRQNKAAAKLADLQNLKLKVEMLGDAD